MIKLNIAQHKYLVWVLFWMINPNTSFSQKHEIGVKTGILMSGSIPFYEGVLDVGSSPSFGIDYSMRLTTFTSLNIEYTWATKARAHLKVYSNSSIEGFRSTLQTHYFQVNRISEFSGMSKFVPYTITGLGLAYFNLDNRGDKSLLGFNLGLGSKLKLTEKLNLKLQGRFLLPLLFEGAGFFVDIFDPSNSGLSLYSTIPLLQGEFSLAFAYKL